MRGLGDDHAVGHAHDPARLAQDDLDLARVAVPALREGDGFRARLDLGEVDDRALRLADDLLGHDQDVVLAQRQQVRATRGQRFSDEAGQVVAGDDLAEPRDRDDLEAITHG